MYAPGTRRHIKAALQLGASMEEIMEVFKLCASAGSEVIHMAVPILAQELDDQIGPKVALTPVHSRQMVSGFAGCWLPATPAPSWPQQGGSRCITQTTRSIRKTCSR